MKHETIAANSSFDYEASAFIPVTAIQVFRTRSDYLVGDLVSVRDAVSEELVNLGWQDERLVVLDADLATSTRVNKFGKVFPDRYFEVGVAEQNMMGIAAGMATFGLIPFTSTFACFATNRATDQIRVSIAQPRLNVKIMGAYAGMYTGKTGCTHQSIEDIAIMRAVPGMLVVEPGDAVEARWLLKEVVLNYRGPVYFRATRDPVPRIFPDDFQFELGKAVTLSYGTDVAIVGQGIMTAVALEAAERLARLGISALVVHVHALKPLDAETLVKVARQTGKVVTVENHSIIGGLGSAVAEVLSEEAPVLVRRVGVKDVYGESGANDDLARKYGLDVDTVVKAVKAVIGERTER